CQKYSGSFTF
nr:immunoglobulin light chain junction region [Macaca mulatta]